MRDVENKAHYRLEVVWMNKLMVGWMNKWTDKGLEKERDRERNGERECEREHETALP